MVQFKVGDKVKVMRHRIDTNHGIVMVGEFEGEVTQIEKDWDGNVNLVVRENGSWDGILTLSHRYYDIRERYAKRI